MKKLLALVGAAAAAFGLQAADYAISFEAAESDRGVDAEAMTFTPGEGWAWDGAATLPLAAYDGDKYAYPTDGDKQRRTDKFAGLSDQDNYLKLDTGTNSLVRDVGSTYLDQLVKFTGFEEVQTNLVAGTKIAVWMSEFVADDNTTVTNLYVTAGRIDSVQKAEPIAIKINGDYNLDTWYRLTIKSLGNIFDMEYMNPRAGFIVYVDGVMIGSTEDVAKDLVASVGEMTGDAKGYMEEGKLFPSLVEDESVEGALFTQVAYQGIGAIDDVIIGDETPAFCDDKKYNFSIGEMDGVEVVKVENASGAEIDAPYQVQANTAVTIYFGATEGYKLVGTDKMVVTIDKEDKLIDPNDGILACEIVAVLNDETELAQVELYEAFQGLTAGDSIQVLAWCCVQENDAEDYLYSFTPNTTIDVTSTGMDIFIGNDAGWSGALEANVGVAEGSTLKVSFEEGYEDVVLFKGNVAGDFELANGYVEVLESVEVSGVIKAVEITLDADLVLTESGKLVTTSEELVVVDEEGNTVTPVADTPEEGWYTYQVSPEPPKPTTYSITYDDYGEWADGFEPVTEYTEETDTFALPVAENIAPRMGGTFKGWTNESGIAVSEVKKGTAGDLSFYAVWETAGTDEVAEEIAEKVETEGMSEDEQKTVRANIIELNEACGGIDAAKSWIAKAYGEGAKIPGAKLVATTPELINIAAKYDLPIMTTEVAVEVGQADDGAFTFKLNDGGEDISIARAKFEEMLRYSTDLENFEVNKEQIEVVVDKDNCTMKATFKKSAGEAKGFMKLVLAGPEK